MPQLTIVGKGSFEVEKGRRLVLAIEDSGVEIGHRCGGHARCTTCRVRFHQGEPAEMRPREKAKLAEKNLLEDGVRLSCQILVEDDMEVEPIITLQDSPSWTDTGPRPDEEIPSEE